jgi:hypothetical protein
MDSRINTIYFEMLTQKINIAGGRTTYPDGVWIGLSSLRDWEEIYIKYGVR